MMRSIAIFFLLLGSYSSQAFINPGPSSPITTIRGANLFCTENTTPSLVSIDADLGSERVWWGDISQPQAFQLTVTSFDRMRCPKCYRIRAQLLVMGQTFNLSMHSYNHTYASGEPTRTLLKVDMTEASTGESQSITLDCGPLF